MELEVDDDDVKELGEENSTEVSIDEFKLLQKEQRKRVLVDISLKAEEKLEDGPSVLIKKCV